MTYLLSPYEVGDLTDGELTPIVAMLNEVAAEENPRSVDMTVDEFRMFSTSPGTVQQRFQVKTTDGDIAGVGVMRFPDDGTNADTLNVAIRVAPRHRRRGIATMLMAEAARVSREEGRTKLHLFHHDTVPAGKAFLDRIEAKPVLEMHVNVLRIEALDKDLLSAWVAEGPSKAPGYRVDVYEGRWPEEILDGMARLYSILDRDMPQPEGHEPRKWTPELISEMHDNFLGGVDSLMALAKHAESGTAVGLSHLIRRHSDPSTWMVTTTIVDPDHRGMSLGRWLKGAVNLEALAQWDGGVFQETANAFVNAPMLAINHEMGFEHELTVTDVQTSVEAVERFLQSRQV